MQNKVNGLGNWLGQHIWQFISRFRNKVYLEDVDPGTTTDVLVREADGEVTVVSGSVIGGVNSVDETTPGTSTGVPIVVDPTTGTVLVQSMAYNGGSNIGHVPAGGLANNWLGGDGTWGGVATSATLGLVELGSATYLTAAYGVGVPGEIGTTYPIQLNSSNQAGVSIPITTHTTFGLTKLRFPYNALMPAANAQTYDAERTYGITENDDNQLIVNVPWTDSGSGVTSVTGTLPIVSSGGTTPAISINTATSTTLGVVELGSDTDLTSTYLTGGAGMDYRTYPVQLNAADQMGVSVPWTDTEYTAGVGLTLTGTVFDANVDGVQSVVPTASSATALRTYKVQVDASDNLVVNVPWLGTTYSAMTTSVLGLGKLRYATGATPAANAQTTTAERTYGVTENASNQLVVNVPWEDEDCIKMTTTTLGCAKLAYAQGTLVAQAESTDAGRTYGITMNASDALVVNVPWRGGSGVDSFTNANGTFIDAGTVNTAATGAVTMGTIDLSAGGTANASTFLRGDNNWASIGATGVSSVNIQVPSTSNGDILSIAPTTGAVVIEPHVYGGAANIGAVPSGGSASTFLRGDATWVTPTNTNAAFIHQHLKAYGKSADMSTSGNEYTMDAPSGNNEHKFGVDVGTSDITSMDPKDAVRGSIMVVQDDNSTVYRWNGWVYGTSGAAVTLRLYMVAPVCEGDNTALSVCKLAEDVTINMLGNSKPICFQATLIEEEECLALMDKGTLIVLTAELEGDGTMNFVVSTSLTLNN